MTLQAKLTLGSVLLATLIVGLISAVDLGNIMQMEFYSTLDRADLVTSQASEAVKEAVNRQRNTTMREAVRDSALTEKLRRLVTASKAILEIALVEPETNEILGDTLPNRPDNIAVPQNPDFRHLVKDTGWLAKVRVLMRSDVQYYQLQNSLGATPDKPLLYVRVIVVPSLIRNEMIPTLKQNANIAIFSVIGAVFLTFLFSTLAFRPLGHIGHMLDLVASG
ncbi:MAG TPA: hypothetical protein VKJ01_11825, partial [Candidatus Solibacter sp.]|nr:hypothetical protein [Candidatus Solibacter sp.]